MVRSPATDGTKQPARDDRRLLPGTWVEVLPFRDLAGTLDQDQSVDGLPFMPEMLPHCGRRFRVSRRAEQTCVYPPEVPFRHLDGTVTLDGLRCDGSAHGGCQLGCTLLWKEAWLRRVQAGNPIREPGEQVPLQELRSMSDPESGVYFCQATQLRRATSPGDPFWKPGHVLGLLSSRTFTLAELVGVFSRLARRRLERLLESIRRRDARPGEPGGGVLGLQAGEWVVVKSREEILQTLDDRGMQRGLPFGGDMWEQCGQRMRVRQRVERIIAEATGHMRTVSDTVTLDDSVCDRYLGCARAMPFLWREAWLRRVEPGPVPGAAKPWQDPLANQP
jgi:hypothetical protein